MTTPDEDLSSQLQPDVPHAARMWNYWMGGKDNFAADRATGDAVAQIYPEIAQNIHPDAKIVYVDNDPMVLVHARALLRGTTSEGITNYVPADYHDPET